MQDLRYALRQIMRRPGFAAVLLVTLALGIGATTAIFTVVNGVLLRPLPYPDADRIVQVWEVNQRGRQVQVADPNFQDWQQQSRSFAALAQISAYGPVSVSGASGPVRAAAAAVSRDFFAVLGLRPVHGRLFTPEEQREGGARAVVISHGFWQRQLGGSISLEDVTLRFLGDVYAVVGVMPPALGYPTGVELWFPRELGGFNPHRTAHNSRVVGRLADGVALARARQETSSISRRLKQEYGDQIDMEDGALVPLREQIVGGARSTLLILLFASGALLLIACGNVLNLLMARMVGRQGEMAIRVALGAGRTRLARQILVEMLVLGVAGGALGVLLAAIGTRALLAFETGNLPRTGDVRVDGVVLAFALTLSVLAATMLGLFTAWRATRGDIRAALAQSQRTQAGAGSSHHIRSALVIAQVALTLVLLVGAGLLGRSFLRLLDVKPGFRTQQTIVLDMAVTGSDEAQRRQIVQRFDEMLARLRAISGVTEVGGVNAFPLAEGGAGNGTFLIMSRPDEPLDMDHLARISSDPSRIGQAEFRLASGDYFSAMQIPLIRGRPFDERDAPDAPHVAIISASLAATRWPDEDPIGKIIQFGNMDGDLRPFTIVGIVGDVRESGLDAQPRPTFYANYRQRPVQLRVFNIAIRSSGPEAAMVTAAQGIVSELFPDVPPRFRTIDAIVSGSVADRRFVLFLGAVFAGAGLLLATLGVYSVISFLVTQRTREIGLRVAVGARTADVLRLVVRQGATLALTGIAIGTVAALALTRLLSGFLFGIGATDPLSFAVVIGLLTSVALLASYLPARRATRVDPMSVLRDV
jgi:predicted permease